MKKTTTIILIAIFLINIKGIAQENLKSEKKSQNQTVENIKKMVNSELQANRFYIACSERATKDGYPKIAAEFTKIAAEENTHYLALKELIKKMKIDFKESKPEFTILSTKENVSISNHLEDVAVNVYQNMIKQAIVDKNKDAENTFKWAMEMEENHSDVFKNFTASIDSK